MTSDVDRRHAEQRASAWPILAAGILLLSVNISAASFAPILDCDEVYNYWEPTHYLNHGYGMQTWEYSPEYAIRSWLYISIHGLIGRVGFPFMLEKRQEFFMIRYALACMYTICQFTLLKAVSRFMNVRIALLMTIIMASSTGMFYASVAYLPSSFSMYTAMMGMAAMMKIPRPAPSTTMGILWFGAGTVIGWPFSAALLAPLLIDEICTLWEQRDYRSSTRRVCRGIVMLVPIILLDLSINALLFRRVAFSPWKIVAYNVFADSSRGPDIFGTEPWHFYIRNLLLNFHAWFLLALGSGPLILLQSLVQKSSHAIKMPSSRLLVFASPFYLWLMIFTLQPHKEERFMYPAYPFLCLNAAISLHIVLYALGHLGSAGKAGRIPAIVKAILAVAALAGLIIVGILRTAGTVTAYGAPLYIYDSLWTDAHSLKLQQQDRQNVSVCLGKEWYRFPSSYFLPTTMRARFIPSAFQGLLPGSFSESHGAYGLPPTWAIPSGMNDQNLPDAGKTVNVVSCDFLIDSHLAGAEMASPSEPAYILDQQSYRIIQCHPFLDTSKTGALGRLFWTPEWHVLPQVLQRHWGRYCLLARKSSIE